MTDRLTAAQRVFDRVQSCGAASPGPPSRLPSLHVRGERLMLDTTGGLYGGQLGVALFTAALDHVDGTDGAADWTDRLTAHLFETAAETVVADRSLGATTGVGSLVYGLSVLETITGEKRYGSRAAELIAAVPSSRVETATAVDVATGLAGLIHAALRLYEHRECYPARELARQCGERLLECQESTKWGRQVWNTNPSDSVDSFGTGFAHGGAGVASALRRLVAAGGRSEFADAAGHAHGFEEAFYSSARNNWRANWTAQPDFPVRWCFGAVGIGHARLRSQRALPSEHRHRPVVERDLRRIESRSWTRHRVDTLCDGSCGVVDLLVSLSRHRDTAGDDAESLLDAVVEREQERGRFAVPFAEYGDLRNPNLFDGVAGVGYTLCRSLAPDRIPSVLGFA